MFSYLKALNINLTKDSCFIFLLNMNLATNNLTYLRSLLSDQENHVANEFINVELSNEYIISRGALRYILSVFINIKPQLIQFFTNKFGKPFVLNPPLNIQFNISHSKDYISFMVSLDYQIGIDIEWINKHLKIEDLCELALSSREINFLKQLNDIKDKYSFFYNTWVKKEAIIKTIGQGLSYPIKNIDVLNMKNEKTDYYISNKDIIYYSILPDLHNYAGAAAFSKEKKKITYINLCDNIIKQS